MTHRREASLVTVQDRPDTGSSLPDGARQDGTPDRHPAIERMGSAVSRLCAADVGDTAAVLSAAVETLDAAWAAASLLARYGDGGDASRWHQAAPLLEAAMEMVENARSLQTARASIADPVEDGGPDRHGTPQPSEGNGAAASDAGPGGPAPLDRATAARMRQEVAATALGLNLVLQWTAHYAAHTHDADACRRAAVLAGDISDCYERAEAG